MPWVLLGIPIGIVLLYMGSEMVCSNAKGAATKLRISPFVIGLTVVSFGSATPEVITAIVSSSDPQLVLGNIVGSNIANVGLVISLAALMAPIACVFKELRFEILTVVAAMVMFATMAAFGTLNYVNGVILIVALLVFVTLTYRIGRSKGPIPSSEGTVDGEARSPLVKYLALIFIGIAMIYVGARVFIDGAVFIAEQLNVSSMMIGLILVAIGTALPELCITLVSAYRKENELAVGNVMGSIIFNTFLALGVGLCLTTVVVNEYVLFYHIPVMILMVVTMALMVRLRNGISRAGGALLLLMYIGYIMSMVLIPELTQGVV